MLPPTALLFALAVPTSTTSPMTLRVLPSKSSKALFPGESHKVRIRDDRMAQFFKASLQESDGVIGQLLLKNGHMVTKPVPLLKVCSLGPAYAELVCVGRGSMDLPLMPIPGSGSHSCASITPVTDRTMQCYPEAIRVIRGLYHSCHKLALLARSSPEASSSAGPLLHLCLDIFELPLEEQLRSRRENLWTAARAGLELAPASYDSATWREQCVQGVSTPWAPVAKGGKEPARPRLNELWCPGNGELQIQLLSFTVAKVLPPSDRLRALSCRDTCSRLEVEASMLRGFERRLAAEVSLQAWARGSSASGESQRPATKGGPSNISFRSLTRLGLLHYC